MATETPTFLSLPQELRDEIYRHLLVSNLPIKCCPVRYNRDTNNPPMALLPTAILQVCRQIHDEAQNIMLRENTFIIDYRGLTYDYEGARDLHSQEVLKQASNLHIIVDIDVQRMFKVAKFLEFHIRLRSLHLEFRLNPVYYFYLGEVGEAYLETFDQALDVLKTKAVREIVTSISTNGPGCGNHVMLWEACRRVSLDGIQVMGKFARGLEAEMRGNYLG